MPRHDNEFDEELRQQLHLLTEKFVRQGMSRTDAAAAARRQLGNVTLLREDRRAILTLPRVESLVRALRYAVRQLRAKPAFTAAAVLSLALGLGANSAVFTLLDQLVLRLLPVPEPERLVMIWSTGPQLGDNRGNRASSYPLCLDYQRSASAFDAIVCRASTAATVTTGDLTEPVRAELITGNYFQGLRVGAALGRVLMADPDDRADSPQVVVLSHQFWVNRFGARPEVVGSKILVNKQPMQVVGVAAAGFTGVDSAESPNLWLPVRLKPLVSDENGLADRNYHFLQIFGRLKPGYTLESAKANLDLLFHRALQQEVLDPQIAKNSAFDRQRFLNRKLLIERAANGYSELRQRYSTALLVLMGMAGLILLIACFNVANLLMARAVARRKEIAVRLSVGASRLTLIGQLLTESTLLALAGCLFGLVISTFSTKVLLGMLPGNGAALVLHSEPDLRILGFGIALTLITVVVFGLLPAMQATRLDIQSTLKSVSSGAGLAVHSPAIRKIFVTTQVTLSFLLLIGAGLFSRTLMNLKHAGSALDRIDQIATFQIDPARSGYPAPAIRKLYEQILGTTKALPGVASAAVVWVPLFQGWAPTWDMRVEGHQPYDGEDMQVANNLVSPEYWRTLGIRLIEGRLLNDGDRFDFSEGQKFPTRAVVNRSFALRFFPKQSAIGKRFGIGEHKEQLGVQIVGVVEDAVFAGPRQGVRPMVYMPFWQVNFPIAATFYVRTAGAPAPLFPTLRRVVYDLDPSLPVYEMKTLEGQLDDSLSTERLIASLSVVFGALATLMAALGLYGVLAFLVSGRTKELGLRIALGAQPRSVSWLVLRETTALVGAGLAIGAPAAYAATRYVTSQLFGVQPADALTFIGAFVLLAIVGLAAAYAPARRAAAVDPLTALRDE